MMLHFFKLIRIQNLLIIALTQYLMRWCIVKPILNSFPIENNFVVNFYELEVQFSEFHFFLLVMATVFLTAAGYVINDYFDRKTDLVNRPETVIIGKDINRRAAMIWHVLFNTLGILFGIYLAFVVRVWQLGFIFIITAGVLWHYSTSYKRQLLTGNLLVAVLTACVPILVSVFEMPGLNRVYRELIYGYNVRFYDIFYWTAGFGYFAFMTTLIMEIIKDVEDFEGDDAYGRNSLPIILGIKWTKTIVAVLISISILSLAFIYFNYLQDVYTLVYFAFLAFLFITVLYLTLKADTKKKYHIASKLTKILMLAGIFYAPLVWYILSL